MVTFPAKPGGQWRQQSAEVRGEGGRAARARTRQMPGVAQGLCGGMAADVWWSLRGGGKVVRWGGRSSSIIIILLESEDKRKGGCLNYFVSVLSLLVRHNMRTGTVYFAEQTSNQMPLSLVAKRGNGIHHKWNEQDNAAQGLFFDGLSLELWNSVVYPAILLGSGSMWVVSSKYRHEIWFLTWYTLANLSSVR